MPLNLPRNIPKKLKHVFLIDPIQYTEKIAKEFYSPSISNSDLEKHTQIIKNPKSSKNIVEKVYVLDSNTYSIPYFKPKLQCPLTTFFNVDTNINYSQKTHFTH